MTAKKTVKKTSTKKSAGKRHDGRAAIDLRPMEAKVGVIKNADGSAMFKIGKTIALAAVYGPRILHPRFLQNPAKGRLRCNYNMMSFSGSGERVRPGPNRRSKEIGLVVEKSLSPIVNLDNYPNSVVDVYIELLQTDAGTRCAGITAAAMALAHAGLEMKDMVCALAVGIVNGKVVADLDKTEEDTVGAVDLPLAITPRNGNFTLLQMDGLLAANQLEEALELAKEASQQIFTLQQQALSECFKNE